MSEILLLSPQAFDALCERGYCCASCGIFYPEPSLDGFCSAACEERHAERRAETKKIFDELVEHYGSEQALVEAMSTAFGGEP